LIWIDQRKSIKWKYRDRRFQILREKIMSDLLLELTDALTHAWNAHDVERIAGFYAANFEGIDISQAAPQRGPQAIQRLANEYLSAFPDLRFENEQTIIQDERVAFVWRAWGTHRGTVMNIPPTCREVSVRGMSLLTFSGRKITHSISVWDLAGFLRAIRLLPEL
jgi:steroid delta-isomerase-like uncharacterized protein